jgi:transposase-like protein
MAPRKLSDADRQEILDRYRLPEETTVTIANHYGVSTSTISRILKQNFSEDEYDALIQQKRSGIKPTGEQRELPVGEELFPERLGDVMTNSSIDLVEVEQAEDLEQPKPLPKPSPRLRNRSVDNPVSESPTISSPSSDRPNTRKRRSKSQGNQLELPAVPLQNQADQQDEDELDADLPVLTAKELKEIEAELGKARPPKVRTAEEPTEEDLEDEDLDDEDDEDLEDDLDDEDLEDEDLEGDFDEDDEDDSDLAAHSNRFSTVQIHGGAAVQILPLAEADIPRTCYIVVDRSSELITRPLKDFADLGQIPEEEISAKTLPVFDNHRVAKRFTRRMQRVVKVPDSRMLQKASPYLQAKGITRVLIDGNVYSLE